MLLPEWMLRAKLENISPNIEELETFLSHIWEARELVRVNEAPVRYGDYDCFIFEGSQGVMLDREYGLFPFVTRSSVSPHAAVRVMEELKITTRPHLYGVTRAYSTRHGDGPFSSHERVNILLTNTEEEINVTNEFQGELRTAPLDLQLIQYAHRMSSIPLMRSNSIVLTCMDQVPQRVPVVDEGLLTFVQKKKLSEKVGAGFINSSPQGNMKRL